MVKSWVTREDCLALDTYSPAYSHLCLTLLFRRMLDQILVKRNFSFWVDYDHRGTSVRTLSQ